MLSLFQSGFPFLTRLRRTPKVERRPIEVTPVETTSPAIESDRKPTPAIPHRRNFLNLRNTVIISRPADRFHVTVGTNTDGSEFQHIDLSDMVVMPIEMFDEIRELIPEKKRVLKNKLMEGYKW